MDLSDPATPQASSSPNDATSTRRSGRVKHKPVLLQTGPNTSLLSNGSGKRKRDANLEEDDVDIIGSESSDLDESDGDPDEEELKEKRRKSRSKKPVTKPAAKRPKTGVSKTTSLPVRPATNGVKKPSKRLQPRAKPTAIIDDDETGLFSELFSQGHTAVAVASEWITRYDQHNANAMCEIINFVFKCTGCDLQVDVHDIEDPDNAASKLEDLQEEHQAKKITDYPLISRAKAYTSFRATMTGFFRALIQTAHAAGLLYSDLALIENIEVWVTTMSASPIRPFRHTATVICLAMQNALCAVYSELADSIANTMRQKEGEQKKKAVNKKRVAELQDKVAEGERKSGLVDTMLENIFNAVFIHRYRDVDPKIRVECVAALGTWITAAPDRFFTAHYLRYLGWLLSDPSPPTRAEVVKHLSKLYKRKEDIGRLRGFTERFRPRFVEMAVRDAEPSIRAAAVEMLDLVRETGLLEPDDIDNIGRLIFDSEPKVRKVVAGFFGENINDLFESVVEELGGDEGMAEAVGDDDPEDPDMPRRSWLKFKCLAEVLQRYSSDGEENAEPVALSTDLVVGVAVENSKYALAAQAVCQGVPDVKDWEVLAGYLLYDNSAVASNSRGSKSPEHLFKERCQLDDFEAMLLLEILNESIKQRLLEAVESETDKKGKRSKARVEEAREAQDNVAIHLAEVIPRLLRKFGANPMTAAVVLRIEHVLNLEIFEELRQGSTAYASLLDEINKQFLTHVDGHVLAEASNAMLRARTFDDLQEVTDSKLQELWSDTVNTLRTLKDARDSGQEVDLDSLRNTVTRIMNLARVIDCISIFEDEPRTKSKNPIPAMTDSLATLLISLLRSDPMEQDDERADNGDVVTTHSIKALLFYHMWLIRSIRTSFTTGTSPASRLPDIDPLADALLTVMITRSGTDSARVEAAEACLDLYTLYASLRNLAAPTSSKDQRMVTPPNKNTQRPHPTNIDTLFSPIPPSCQTCILTTFTAVEKLHARLSHRSLESAPDDGIDDAPEDPDSDMDDDDEETASGKNSQTQKLLVERSLCALAGKMVLAVVGRVFAPGAEGAEKVRSRLKRNEKRLGANYREVVAYLDEKKAPRATTRAASSKSKAKAPAAAAMMGKKKGAGRGAKSKEKVVDISSESEEEEVRGDEDEDEGNGELPDDRIEDVDGDEAGNAAPRNDEEDEIMGD
ncbi:MAG: hypothetical protein Q9208_008552 [Pyrenodesmia sp. 3 TL-2023]